MEYGSILFPMWDISLPIDEQMPAWPGTPPTTQQWLERLATGDACDVSAWSIGSHAGTHLDAPSHFLAGGADLEAVGLSPLIGTCLVSDAVVPHERLLLRGTLSVASAQLLIDRGVRLVGTDALSIEPPESVAAGAPVHRLLLSAGVPILEGLVLDQVPASEYFLVALPLRLQHSEASPVRAVLLDFQGLFRR
jgi:arylformamidase